MGKHKRKTSTTKPKTRKAYSHTKWSDSMTTYHGGQGYGYGGTTYKSCAHAGTNRVFNIDGRHVYGAGTAIRFRPNTALVIDLAHSYTNGNDGRPKSMRAFLGSATDEVIKALFPPPPEPLKPARLELNWPDMQAPDIDMVGVDFWKIVWSIMPVADASQTADQAPHTIVCCMGGHGRTGTCLAALLICNAGFSMPNAVNFVRYNHCVKAVESTSQINYLRELAKRAGTNTQPLDQVLVAKVEALGDPDAGDPSGTKSGPSKLVVPAVGFTPSKSGGALVGLDTPSVTVTQHAPLITEHDEDKPGVINPPLSDAEIAKRKAALQAVPVEPLPDVVLQAAKFYCIEATTGLTWVSREVYDAGTYGDKPDVLGVRFV